VIDTSILIAAYSQGIFPMSLGEDQGGEIGWFSPDPRGIIPLDAFSVPRRLARVVRQNRFEIRLDSAFEAVMHACAASPRGDHEGTWISEEIIESYVALYARGLAHSVEAWREGKLVGGLYGVHLGSAFFGESMFHTETDASKVALAALVGRLRERGFTLLDTQWTTPHLEQFGAVEIPKTEYLLRLADALGRRTEF
jgi:leucyl/phenylalanyl-tRNA--protein transferase